MKDFSTASKHPTAAIRALFMAGILAMVSLGTPAPARGTPLGARDAELAQSLFDGARALMDQGKFREACPMLAESQRLDPGGGALLNLAVCLEQAGQLASAQTAFQEALRKAIEDKREDRKRIAEDRIAAITPRLSTLTVDVPEAARVPGMEVRVDGSKLDAKAWGVKTPVDGGDHRIEATAPERGLWATVRTVAQEGAAVVVTIPALVLVSIAPPPILPLPNPVALPPCSQVVAGHPCTAEPPRAAGIAPAPLRRISVGSWTLGSIGVALAATTIGTGIGAVVLNDHAKSDAFADGCNLARSYCPSGHTTSALSTASAAHTLGWVATIAGFTGGIALATAVLLPRSTSPVTVRGGAAIHEGWVAIETTF